MLSENLHTHPTFVTSIIIYTLPLIQIIVNVLVPSHIILKISKVNSTARLCGGINSHISSV